jgi:hypothetical protein
MMSDKRSSVLRRASTGMLVFPMSFEIVLAATGLKADIAYVLFFAVNGL